MKHTWLITLAGPGGIGKTRLALECAAQQVGHFPHGVFFVPLVGFQLPDHIVPAVAEAVGCQIQDNNHSPRQQVLDHLREKRMLLVMDNFEHLIEGAALVTDILQHAPDVTILATSREKLNLSGETVVPLAGLELPEADDASDPLKYSAVRLFMQSAWQTRPDFDPAADRLQYAARICRLVNSAPLGVLLAASWIEMLSLREIAEEIDHGLGFLETDRRDLPDRHRSLRAVFESSWQHLPDAERGVLMRRHSGEVFRVRRPYRSQVCHCTRSKACSTSPFCAANWPPGATMSTSWSGSLPATTSCCREKQTAPMRVTAGTTLIFCINVLAM